MNHTHRFVGTDLYRPDGHVEHGELFTPTEAELRSFGDVIEPLDTRSAEDVLGDVVSDADDYRELQRAASEYDDIPGNLSKSELRSALVDKLR